MRREQNLSGTDVETAAQSVQPCAPGPHHEAPTRGSHPWGPGLQPSSRPPVRSASLLPPHSPGAKSVLPPQGPRDLTPACPSSLTPTPLLLTPQHPGLPGWSCTRNSPFFLVIKRLALVSLGFLLECHLLQKGLPDHPFSNSPHFIL